MACNTGKYNTQTAVEDDHLFTLIFRHFEHVAFCRRGFFFLQILGPPSNDEDTGPSFPTITVALERKKK